LPIGVAWTSPDSLAQGSTVAAAVQLSRAAGTSGGIRLRLLTTQPAIKKTIKENNVDKQVDDLGRMLRLEADIVVPADQPNGEVKIFVPADLPMTPWDAALVAELLSADGKTSWQPPMPGAAVHDHAGGEIAILADASATLPLWITSGLWASG
jgi:hypothetical protein